MGNEGHKRDDPSVLGNLPSARPQRLGRPRAENGAPPRRKREPARAEDGAPPRRKREPARAVAAAKPATRRRRPAVAKPAAPTESTAPSKPTAVRPGARELPPLRRSAPPERSVHPPRGTELVTTAIQAAGELAQLGFTVGGHMLKRAVDRLPRP